MPVSFRKRPGGSIFGDPINLGSLGDGVVLGNSPERAYVVLKNTHQIIPGRVNFEAIQLEGGRPGRCFTFTPENSEDYFQFSDTSLVTR